MPLDPDAVQRVDDAARRRRRSIAPLIVLHVSAGNPFRRWPAESFASAAAALASADPSRRIIITSGPSEALPPRPSPTGAAARRHGGRAHRPHRRIRSVRAQRPRRSRRAYIGGDSGPLHIAPRRARRSSRCSARRFPIDRCRGAIRRSAPSRSMAASCRAAPATNATACPATFAV
jgi:hypothetical protein